MYTLLKLSILQGLINEHKQRIKAKDEVDCFIDVFLKDIADNGNTGSRSNFTGTLILHVCIYE